jgi:hypothetical protein
MMTFYSAAGSYQLREENGKKKPYIQRLGCLYPISIPEFVIWSSLLWQVMTYEELEQIYRLQMQQAKATAPKLDEMLQMLVKRKLVVRGEGYTGVDALYNMLSDAFVIPTLESRKKKFSRALGLLARGKINLAGLKRIMQPETLTETERKIMALVRQTPLSVPEITQCFLRNVTDVSSPEKVINGIYPREDSCQATIANEMYPSPVSKQVLEAVANLYMNRYVILEQP